tara:strand:+ start:822 stop:1106 length:285 start_codon:yes stop_codon:yes gene_type:complete
MLNIKKTNNLKGENMKLAKLEDLNAKLTTPVTYGLYDNVRDAFKKEYDCSKITEIKYLKRKNIWRANCFQYVGNRQYKFYGVRFITSDLVKERA